MYYTGVGARKTPGNVLGVMTGIAQKMATLGYTLRTGDAIGADAAFRLGAGLMKEVYTANQATPEAIAIAGRYHGAWNKCSAFVKCLHGRNAFQVLGPDLNTLSAYCICWTPDGATTHRERCWRTGGTGTAISIANKYDIAVVNLAIPSHFNHWKTWLNF